MEFSLLNVVLLRALLSVTCYFENSSIKVLFAGRLLLLSNPANWHSRISSENETMALHTLLTASIQLLKYSVKCMFLCNFSCQHTQYADLVIHFCKLVAQYPHLTQRFPERFRRVLTAGLSNDTNWL